MSNAFAEGLEKTFSERNAFTENGAVGYASSGTALADFVFKISSYRNASDNKIGEDFGKVFKENPRLAIKAMFMAGDIRDGMGERRVFKVCLQYLLKQGRTDILERIIGLIPHYNWWDTAVEFVFNEKTSETALELVAGQFGRDLADCRAGKPISLLAKWMPSVNTSSRETVRKGRALAEKMGLSEKDYRKALAELRKHLHVVETLTCAGRWSEIDYNAVPSKANLLYKDAFLKHDEARRAAYIEALQNGSAKINSSVAFPYDIVHKYTDLEQEDAAFEQMWKALPDFTEGKGGETICMVDGSGSMTVPLGRTRVTALEVANSLGIYFAEKKGGAFHNMFITFSQNPKLVSFGDDWSLARKLEYAYSHDDCSNTNLRKAFDLILQTAVRNGLKQADLPKTVLVLSDMEFDGAVDDVNYLDSDKYQVGMTTLFERIRNDYAAYGFIMPKLVFWNLGSRTKVFPVKENEMGVALISGFSPTLSSMVFSQKTDPYDAILERLESERYDRVEAALAGLKI